MPASRLTNSWSLAIEFNILDVLHYYINWNALKAISGRKCVRIVTKVVKTMTTADIIQ